MGIYTAVNQDCGTLYCKLDTLDYQIRGAPCTKGLFNGGWTDWVKTDHWWSYTEA